MKQALTECDALLTTRLVLPVETSKIMHYYQTAMLTENSTKL